MDLSGTPIFDILKRRLSYLADRQQVISQNVANSDTPRFTPRDLKPFSLPKQGGLTMTPVASSSASMFIAPPGQTSSGEKPIDSPDSETTLDGNSVVLEDEMMKMTQARMDYDAAVSFYQQATLMIQTAAKRPGQ